MPRLARLHHLLPLFDVRRRLLRDRIAPSSRRHRRPAATPIPSLRTDSILYLPRQAAVHAAA
jgi:hypothetical protein